MQQLQKISALKAPKIISKLLTENRELKKQIKIAKSYQKKVKLICKRSNKKSLLHKLEELCRQFETDRYNSEALDKKSRDFDDTRFAEMSACRKLKERLIRKLFDFRKEQDLLELEQKGREIAQNVIVPSRKMIAYEIASHKRFCKRLDERLGLGLL